MYSFQWQATNQCQSSIDIRKCDMRCGLSANETNYVCKPQIVVLTRYTCCGTDIIYKSLFSYCIDIKRNYFKEITVYNSSCNIDIWWIWLLVCLILLYTCSFSYLNFMTSWFEVCIHPYISNSYA